MTNKENISSPKFPILKCLNLYKDVVPDPIIHGSGPFVASLPAKDRAAPDQYTTLKQYPIWHPDCTYVGSLYETDSIFKKQRKGGCISLIYEQQLRRNKTSIKKLLFLERGIHGYSFKILAGNISAADGVGFAFGGRVPCSKNIKRLWSVFVNRTGRITKCMGGALIHDNVPELPPFAIGNTLSIVIDLNLYRATFEVKNATEVMARAHVDLHDIAERIDASSGYLCAAVARAGIVAQLLPAPISIMELPEVNYVSKVLKYPNQKPQKQKQNYIRWPYNVSAPEFYPNNTGILVGGNGNGNRITCQSCTPDASLFAQYYQTATQNLSNENYIEPLPLIRASAPITYATLNLQENEVKPPINDSLNYNLSHYDFFHQSPMLNDLLLSANQPPVQAESNFQKSDSILSRLCDSWLVPDQPVMSSLAYEQTPNLLQNARTESAITTSDALKLLQKLKKINPDLLLNFSEFDYLLQSKYMNTDFNKKIFDNDFNLLLETDRTLSAPSGNQLI